MANNQKTYEGEFTYNANQLEYVIQAKKGFRWFACCLLPLLILLLLLLLFLLYWLFRDYTPPVPDGLPDDVDVEVFSHPVQVRLYWHNDDDLDLTVIEPGETSINYQNLSNDRTGGTLNYDMNNSEINDTDPSEHISWADTDRMREGSYEVKVSKYKDRSSANDGYTIELYDNDHIYRFDMPHSPSGESGPDEAQFVVRFKWSEADGISITRSAVDPQVIDR